MGDELGGQEVCIKFAIKSRCQHMLKAELF